MGMGEISWEPSVYLFNFFENLKSLIDPKYEEAFNYIPNNSNYIIMSERVDQVRKMVRSDIWKLIDHVDQGTIK